MARMGMKKMDEPIIYEIKNGWAASNPDPRDRWAVHGATREEAERRFREVQIRHQEIDARPEPEMAPYP